MPYLTAAQRYRDRPTPLGYNSANRNPEKIRSPGATKEMNLPWQYQSNPGGLQYNALHTGVPIYEHGFGRNWAAHREGWQAPVAGYAGYEHSGDDQLGYQPAFYGQRNQGQAYSGSWYGQPVATRSGTWRQQSRPDYRALYPTAPEKNSPKEGKINEPAYFQAQQQYAPVYFHYSPYPTYVPVSYAPSQPWLTQQWQTADVVLSPPPPPPQGHTPTQSFSVNAPTFIPQKPVKSVIARDLDKIFRVDKTHRFHETRRNAKSRPVFSHDNVPPQPGANDLSYPPGHWKDHVEIRPVATSRRKKNLAPSLTAEQAQRQLSTQSPSLKLNLRSSPSVETPKKHVMPRPEPSETYLRRANQEPITMDASRPLLIVLDLNGTVLYRGRRRKTFTSRPRVMEFLHYLFSHHHVLVWSSAMPTNVQGMCKNLLSKDQHDQMIACWARDKLRIPPHAYHDKVQVYKQLSWIWKDKEIQAVNPNSVDFWSQENTVLIEDSLEKAASEPYNVVKLEEFEGREEQMESDVLGQVVKYLETLRCERNVSAYIRRKPFMFDAEGSFDWSEIINEMH